MTQPAPSESFQATCARVEQIIDQISSPETDVDELVHLVDEATQKLLNCKNLLTQTEENVLKRLAELDQAFVNPEEH